MSRDLMHAAELRDLVREAYRAIRSDTRDVARMLYDPSELAGLPEQTMSRALGVNNHLRHAVIEPGSTLLDVGCGGGIDTIIAAKRVGASGKVIALDLLPEMLERTMEAAAEAGLTNVVPLEGEMESIPLPDDAVDHLISNGVINLSARKARVLAECARVLRPGGRFTVSDLAVEDEALPTEVMTHPAAWAG